MQIERYEADRTALLPLFALADDSPAQVATYISLGEVFVARHGELIVGYAQIVESEDPREFELKSLAVIEARQGEGSDATWSEPSSHAAASAMVAA
jgi:hypothetical protein